MQTLYGKTGRRIPRARLEERVWPYLYVWETLSSDDLDYDDTLFRNSDIVFRQVEDEPELKAKLPEGFYRWACFNYRESIRDFVETLEEKEAWWRIASARASGQKLAEIGEWAGLTSERVRQICNLLINRAREKDGFEIIGKVAAILGKTDCVTCEELNNELGRKSQLLVFLLTSMIQDGDAWYYWDDAKSIVLEGGKKYADEMAAYVEKLPGVIPIQEVQPILDKTREDGYSPDIVEQYIKNMMEFDGHNYHIGPVQTQDVCEDIMRTYFQDGLYIYDKKALNLFREKAVEKYGENVPVPENDHAMTVLLNRISMLRDRGIYVPVRKGILPPELVQRMRKYMEENGQVSYMYNTLFGVFRDDLLKVGIDNRYYLQGALRQDLGEGYSLTRDYVTTDGENKQLKDPVIQYIYSAGKMVTKEELSNVFHTSPYLAYNCALMDRKIVNYFGQYMHIDNLGLTEEDKQHLKAEVDELLADGQKHEVRELLKVMRRKYPDLVKKAKLDAPYPLFSLVNCLYGDDYMLARPYMALKGSNGERDIIAVKGEPGTRTKAHTSMPKFRVQAGPEKIVQTIEEKGNAGMTVSELHRQFHATKQYILNACDIPEMIFIGERMVSVKNIKNFEEAREGIYKVLQEELDRNHVIRRRHVSELLREKFPDFFDENNLYEPDAPFYFTKYIFQRQKYKDVTWFFHPHNRSISISENDSDVTLMGQVRAYCHMQGRPVTMEEIRDRLVQLGYNTDNLKYNLHLCEDPFLFVYGHNLYILSESLNITETWIKQVQDGIRKLFEQKGKLVPFKQVSDEWMEENFPRLPEGLHWNRYLLQQICLFYGDRIGAKTLKPIGMYDFNRLHSFIVPYDSVYRDVGDATWHYLKSQHMTGAKMTVHELTDVLRDYGVIGDDDQNRAHRLDRFLTNPAQFIWNVSGSRVEIQK